jgi:phosphatidate cytidylyltransferase
LIVYASKVAFKNLVGSGILEESTSKSIMPILYPTLPMLFMLSLLKDYGITALVWLVLIVAVCDVGAYFTGRAIGRTPFSPASPNKTFEGVVGGVLIATAVGAIAGVSFLTIFKAIIISFLVAVASIFGDLFESSLKRNAGVKDSGNILPGHGGVLDRLDGHLFGAVVMVLILRWIY